MTSLLSVILLGSVVTAADFYLLKLVLQTVYDVFLGFLSQDSFLYIFSWAFGLDITLHYTLTGILSAYFLKMLVRSTSLDLTSITSLIK